MMDILKRIDQAQQFCKFYADGAYSVETAQWNHHVNPEFIEDIRQYIESLQLKLMHLQTQQAHRAVCKSESYDMIDRFLRNQLYDDDYESYSDALDEIAAAPVAPPKPEYVLPTAIEVQNAKENLVLMKQMFGDANEPVLRYDGLHEYASQHRLNYNELCSVVRASITHPPQRKPLTVMELQDALVYTNLIDPDAVNDPEGYDEGSTLAQIDALHQRLTGDDHPCNPQEAQGCAGRCTGIG